MSEESASPDLAERWRRSFTAFSNGDIGAPLRLWGPDPVWDLSPMGLGVYDINGVIVRITNYSDIDEARAAAERLTEEEG